MTDIVTFLHELNEINKEIKILYQDIGKFKTRKLYIEKYIQNFLKETNKPGVKFKNLSVVLEDKKRKIKKKKNDKMESCLNVLNRNGISGGIKVYNELMDALKGDEQVIKIVKINDLTGH